MAILNRFQFDPRKGVYSIIIVNIEAIEMAIFPATITMMSGEHLFNGSICLIGARTCWVIMGGKKILANSLKVKVLSLWSCIHRNTDLIFLP